MKGWTLLGLGQMCQNIDLLTHSTILLTCQHGQQCGSRHCTGRPSATLNLTSSAEWSNVPEGRRSDTFDLSLTPMVKFRTSKFWKSTLWMSTYQNCWPPMSPIQHSRPCRRVNLASVDLPARSQFSVRARTSPNLGDLRVLYRAFRVLYLGFRAIEEIWVKMNFLKIHKPFQKFAHL